MPLFDKSHIIQDEGVDQGPVTKMNFVGSSVVATVSGDTATITVSAGGAASIANGTVTIDFTSNSQIQTVTITGQTSIAGSSTVLAFMMGSVTSQHNAYEHAMASRMISFTCGNIIAGTGFDIVATSDFKLTGTFTVNWMWF